jgi:hypothetical protein
MTILLTKSYKESFRLQSVVCGFAIQDDFAMGRNRRNYLKVADARIEQFHDVACQAIRIFVGHRRLAEKVTSPDVGILQNAPIVFVIGEFFKEMQGHDGSSHHQWREHLCVSQSLVCR